MSDQLDFEAVKSFKNYLRIKSVQPECDYSTCVDFFKDLNSRIGLSLNIHVLKTGNPVVIFSWEGTKPGLPSVLLSSHMDVVPVYVDCWAHDPFAAEEDENGNIFARGAQDCKCLGIQYLEAVYRLKLRGFTPKRTVHVCFTPDEEIGSLGMKDFVEMEAFRDLNVGCAMDEGGASPGDSLFLFHGERTAYNLHITCSGSPGHGSALISNTAGEKLSFILQQFFQKRAEEMNKLISNSNLSEGDVTVVNLTVVEGGVQVNVIPPQFKAIFDCRLSLSDDHDEFEEWVRDVCTQAGEGVKVEFVDKKKRVEATVVNDDNPWWMALKNEFDKMGLEVLPRICPAATDSRYLRSLGIPCFNFSPMNHTQFKIHEHNEFLNKKVFLKGVEIFCGLIPAISNV